MAAGRVVEPVRLLTENSARMLARCTPRALARLAVVLIALLASLHPNLVSGQRIERIPESLIRDVIPGADRFGEVNGDPPVILAFTESPDDSEVVFGYVFLTSDLPPEQYGYSGADRSACGDAARWDPHGDARYGL